MTSRSHAASQPTGTGRSTGRPELGLVSREAYDLYCWGCGASGQLGNEVFRDEGFLRHVLHHRLHARAVHCEELHGVTRTYPRVAFDRRDAERGHG